MISKPKIYNKKWNRLTFNRFCNRGVRSEETEQKNKPKHDQGEKHSIGCYFIAAEDRQNNDRGVVKFLLLYLKEI